MAAEELPEAEASTPAERQAGQQMLELIKRLALIRSAKSCDEWCLAFCDLNSKASRNRLVSPDWDFLMLSVSIPPLKKLNFANLIREAGLQIRELTDINPNKLALLPFYARVTATLSQISSTIREGVLASLERSFKYFKVSACFPADQCLGH